MRIKVLLIGTLALHLSGCASTEEDNFSNLVRINPVPQAQQFVQQEKYAEANNYLSYFMDYDYVKEDPEATQLYKHIQDTRDNWMYKLKKVNSGFWVGESDETEGEVAAVVSDFLVIGDIRDLGKEGKNYIQGKEVDNVTMALAAVGLVATGATLVTAGTAVAAKPSISFLKMANKAGKMPNWLGKWLIESAEIAKKTKKLDHISSVFSDIQELNKTAGARTTLELLAKSESLDDFHELAKFGNKFGTKTSTLLKVAGDDAITISKRMENVPKEAILEAGTFGRDGIKSLEKYGAEKFQEFPSSLGRRMTNLEKEFSESGIKTKFSGRDFIKRDYLSDSKYVDATGMSKKERMTLGLAPIGKDGNPINLHHMKQQNNGVIVELSQTEHKKYSDILHRYAGRGESEINREEFNELRSAYWKERAKHLE